MSILSYIKPEFVKYLYNNGIKIHTYESYESYESYKDDEDDEDDEDDYEKNKGYNITGYWAFLNKNNERGGYITQMYYYIRDTRIRIRFTNWSKNRDDLINIKKVKTTSIFYILSIYSFLNHEMININELIDDDDDDDYEYFLCRDENKKCTSSSLSIRDIKDILEITNFPFSITFIKNYIDKNQYIINTQEFLEPNKNEGMYGYISLIKNIDNTDNENILILSIYFRKDYDSLHIDINLDIDELDNVLELGDYNIDDKKDCDAFEIILLHIFSCLANNKIIVRISIKNNKTHDVLLKMGLEMYKIHENIKYIHMETTRNKVLPYIEKKWEYERN